MNLKKNILTTIISLSFILTNSTAFAGNDSAANGKRDISNILENNTEINKDDFIIDYYKSKGSEGKVLINSTFDLNRPLEMTDLAFLNDDLFASKLSNLTEEDLEKIANDSMNSKYKKLREDSVYNEAIKIGIQNALFKVLFDFKESLQEITPEYKQIFNFKELMLAHGKVKPPVILEAGSGVNKEGLYQIRSNDASYEIYSQAEVALRAPSFLDYLTFEPIKPQEPELLLLPINDKERNLWANGVKEGWILGIRQGNSIINEGLASLIRDYVGMQRFHLMKKSGIISMPEFEKMDIGTTTNGSNLNIGESTFKIVVLPEFNSNSQSWKSLPRIEDFLKHDIL